MAPTQLDLTAVGPRPRTWVLTDGKAGDEGQCVAVVEALGLSAEIRRVSPRRPFVWLMPWGPVDPAEAPDRPGSPIAPPLPDLVVASGRRAVPYLRCIRHRSKGATYTVFLKDPRTGPSTADLICAPSYDRVRGPNVVTTLTAPHRVTPERLAEARAVGDARLRHLSEPRAAVLVGGNSRHGRFTASDTERLLAQLRQLTANGVSLAITASRRTPPDLAERLRDLAATTGGYIWDGAAPNPYVAMLALADAIVVTGDSVNMTSEAVATGAPVLVFELGSASRRHRHFVRQLEEAGCVRSFGGKLERFAYEKLDSTPAIAQAVAAGFAAHRAVRRLG